MSFSTQQKCPLPHQTGRLQLFIKRELLAETSPESGNLGFKDFNLLDLGDFVEATGKVMRTQRGEISIQPSEMRILAKSIRPLPDQWSGLQDREQVLRKRYLDTILEPESHRRFGVIPPHDCRHPILPAGEGLH